jgi:hypothetical protein
MQKTLTRFAARSHPLPKGEGYVLTLLFSGKLPIGFTPLDLTAYAQRSTSRQQLQCDSVRFVV